MCLIFPFHMKFAKPRFSANGLCIIYFLATCFFFSFLFENVLSCHLFTIFVALQAALLFHPFFYPSVRLVLCIDMNRIFIRPWWKGLKITCATLMTFKVLWNKSIYKHLNSYLLWWDSRCCYIPGVARLF